MTKWLVTGAGGMLGRDVLSVLEQAPGAAVSEVSALDRTALDITDPDAVREAVRGHDLVVNCAAWTDVDGAEAKQEEAAEVNGTAVRHLAAACDTAILVHVSTDYVMSGRTDRPYTEADRPDPVNSYGRSKLLGEQAVAELLPDRGYVVRTAWLYGEHGRNFVATMLRMAAQREHVDVVDDQHGQPTWSWALAGQLMLLGLAARAGEAGPGIYHCTSSGQTTWFQLAREVFRLAGLDPERVRPTTSESFQRPARRPASAVLAHDRWLAAGLPPLPDWRESLAEAMRQPAFAALAAAARAGCLDSRI